MKIEFNVVGAEDSIQNKNIDYNGQTVTAAIPCYSVNLVDVKDNGNALTHKFFGKEIAAAKKIFFQGATVTWEIN